jgi:hypothetical protein
MNKPEEVHSFAYIENEVIIWGRARQIIQNSSSRAQASKCLEEVDELLDHTSELRGIKALKRLSISDGMDDILDSAEDSVVKLIEDDIGDILVTLIMVAEIEGLSLTGCLAKAYSEIKDRKGYLGADGKFHKE